MSINPIKNFKEEPFLGDDKKYHYLYQVTNLKNGKIYIGIHSTENLNDGYFGSGTLLKRSIEKHNAKNFIFDVLYFFKTRDDLILMENQIVDEKFVSDPMTYNLQIGGGNGTFDNQDFKKRRSEYMKLNNPMFDECIREKLRGENHPMYGKNHTNEAKQLISEKNSGRVRSEELKDKLRKIHSNYVKITKNRENKTVHVDFLQEYLNLGWKLGKYISEDQKNKQKRTIEQTMKNRVAMTNEQENKWVEECDVELYKRSGWREGFNFNNKNKKFINKNGINKFVNKEDVDFYLKDDWKIGRTKNRTKHPKSFSDCMKKLKWVNKDGSEKRINQCDLELYLSNGWKIGRK